MKHKYDCVLLNPDIFKADVRNALKPFNYDVAIYPQSSNGFAQFMAESIAPTTIRLEKNTLEDVQTAIKGLKWSRIELESQLDRMAEMGDEFRINLIKANQRHRYIPYLFKKVDVPTGRVAIVDDSLFTSTTMKAMISATECEADIFVAFSR